MKGAENPGKGIDKVLEETLDKTLKTKSTTTSEKIVDNIL